jgi:PAS domain S-box-containing protein
MMKNVSTYNDAVMHTNLADNEFGKSGSSRKITARGKLIQETRERSQKRFRYAFLTSPDSVAIIRLEGSLYTDVNEMFSIFTGYTKDEIIGRTFTEIPIWHDSRNIAMQLKKGPIINREISLQNKNGEAMTGLLSAMTMPLDDVPHIVLSIRNIDDLKKIEKALEKSEARYRELFNNMSSGVAVFEVRENGQLFEFIDFNNAAQSIENISKESVLGKNVVDVIPSVEKYGLLDAFKRVWATGKPEYFPVAVYQDNELKVWKDNYIYKLPTGEIVDMYDDVTERKDAETKLLMYQEKLQSLASELSLVEEQERRTIATDLHDQVGQTLSVIKMRCFSLREKLTLPEQLQDLDEIFDLVQQTIQDIRSLTFELSPPVLYELGLVAAIEWLAEQFQKKHNLQCIVESDNQPKPLNDDIKVVLFRSVRELLVNIVKHADAKNARITIRIMKGTIRVRVTDDGIGYRLAGNNQNSPDALAFGLFSISERLRHLGGELEIDSKTGQGTMVTLLAPLKNKTGDRKKP